MRRRGIILSVLGLIVIVAIISVTSYFNSTYVLTVAYTHASNVKAVDAKTNRTIATVAKSGDTVRLYKNVTYLLDYKGDDGYASDPVTVKFENKELQSVTIDPYFSKDKLASMLAAERDAIRKVLTDTYPTTIGLYTINQGSLYHFGEWYGTTMTYNGPDFYNYDTVRVAMKKENDTWKLISQPPMPGLTIYNAPGTPVDVLTAINHQE